MWAFISSFCILADLLLSSHQCPQQSFAISETNLKVNNNQFNKIPILKWKGSSVRRVMGQRKDQRMAYFSLCLSMCNSFQWLLI